MRTKFLEPIAVANWFIKKAVSSGSAVTAISVQKLVFFAHGWCLALYDQPLVNEQAEAWEFAPVFPTLDEACIKHMVTYNLNADSPLSKPFPFSEDYRNKGPVGCLSVCDESPGAIPLLDRIWDVYGGIPPRELSAMVTKQGGPWHETISSYPKGIRRPDIPNDTLRKHFKSMIKPVAEAS